jgi:type IV pilus assembly protein PilQ
VKRRLGFGGFISSAAAVVFSAQAAQAAATQITNVEVNQAGSGFEVVLQTNDGERPQVFTVNRGNALIADLVNTELQLPQGKSFEQSNPAPGIRSITVSQLDANSVRVTVDGGNTTPVGQVSQGEGGIVLNVSQAAPAQTAPAPAASSRSNASAQANRQTPPPTPPAAVASSRDPNVMVPNPQITIDGVPAVQGTPEYTPPLVPRAIAPPLGDISVSNIDTGPSEVRLSSNEVVPRLVLRDAPARDVLSLLARAAGMNVAYINAAVGQESQGQQAGGGDAAGQTQNSQSGQAPQEVRISLDIENEPVQNVFNYVLRVANLEANRVGRTIFVGPRLPDTARNVISRTLRMNQVSALSASTYLATLGAEARQLIPERNVTETVTEGGVTRTTEKIEDARIQTFQVPRGSGPLPLQGLSVSADTRLNSLLLVGEPRTIQIAEAMLTQLDLRQRQVAVNVKIVDVNLLGTEDFNTSFSWGDGDFFAVIDRGAAVMNVGGNNPPNAVTTSTNLFSPPIIPNPYEDATPFLDPSERLNIPGGGGGVVQPNGQFDPTDASFLNPIRPLGNNGNPLNPGVTDFEQGDPTIITRDNDGNLTVTRGTTSTITSGMPSLFQYPQRFLARLQAQIVSGNAKVLTDPTLVVQEGEIANVNLGQEVISQVDVQTQFNSAGTTQTQNVQKVVAGLQMAVQVERIDDNGFVTLRVQPTVTAPVSTTRLGERGQEVTLLSVRQVQSGRIRLRDDQTLILSGIIQETDRTTVTKVPILGDIPILGALFRSTNRQNSRQEVVALVTPKILDDSDFSNFGYRYTPGREVQEVLQRRGVQVP